MRDVHLLEKEKQRLRNDVKQVITFNQRNHYFNQTVTVPKWTKNV